jgi:hypothetical protein
MQDLFAVKDLPPPVPEDRVARQVRRLSVAQEKKEKDVVKTRRNRKIREHEVLLKRCRQQRLEGLPEEESPSEMASEEEDDDSDDNDAGSWYDIVTFLVHLPNVRSLQGPIGRGSTSQASRVASAPVEGEEERPKGRAHERPSKRRFVEPRAPLMTSAVPQTRAQSPRTSSVGGAVTSTPMAEAPSSGVRTRGQTVLTARRTPGTPSAQAQRSSGPARGSTEGPSQGALGSSGKLGTKPLIPMSG